jgi:serine/threonine protein kinase
MADAPNTGTICTAKLIDRLCDEFERGWVEKSPARIEDLVPAHPEPLRPVLLRELLAVERECRAKDGRPVTLDEARQRFARLGPWAEPVVEELLATPAGWEQTCTPGLRSAALSPRPDGLPATVGKFRVVRELGGGGMGIVYLADDPDGRRQVAVKVMRPNYAVNRSARERFLREARSAMTIEHDHVVTVYQVEENAGSPFLVMPLLKGESLEARLTRDPLPPVELVVKVGLGVARGLVAAHEKGLVHRDVKPGNTWLEGDPSSPDPGAQVRHVKVLDFGLAGAADATEGVLATGSVVGTPQYMAPEQAAGEPTDGRADLFSLGAVLYRMAAGRPAFTGPTTTALLTAIATHHPPSLTQVNPSVPPDLSALIDRLLAKDPRQRPGSAAEVAEALAAIDRRQPVPSPGAPARRWWPAVLTAAVLVFGVGVGIWAVVRPSENPSEPRPDRTSAKGGDPGGTGMSPPSAPVVYRSRVDLLVERDNQLVRLSNLGALPLRENDGWVIVGEVDPPAYLYVVWVDPNHDVTPVYPWDPTGGPRDSDPWQTRPATESPVPRIRVPEPGRVYSARDAKPGVATVVLFARRTPLDVPHGVVRAWFESLPELVLAPEDEGAAVWFDDFRKVTGDDLRRGTFVVKEQRDPFAAWQGRLYRVLGDHVNCQSAVSFARTGNAKDK